MEKYIWVIDDDQGILDVVEIILQEAGYRVRKIEREEVLNEALNDELPQAILLDILISGLDGREVAKRLKSDVKTKHIHYDVG
jgi:DNA-binding NtrC family response regulator